jgi:excisionase family DNA binding protein
VPEAAEYLNTSVRFVRRIIADRRVAFHKIGRHIRFALDDLDAFISAGRVEVLDADSVWANLREVA